VRAATRTVTLALLFVSGGCLVALHMVRGDLDPIARRLSEYATGPYSFVMAAVFYATGLALLTLSAQVAGAGSAGVIRLAAALIALAGAGLVLSGVFRTGTDSMLVEIVHSRASGTSVIALTAAAALTSIHPAFDGLRRWDTAARLLTAVVVVAVVVSPILHATRWAGLSQRVVWFSLAAWLLMTAWHMPTD
jgi:hypothetical membrane protein